MTSYGNPPRNNPAKRTSHGSNPPLGDPAPESVPYGDPESENYGSTMRTGGAARPSHNPGKKKGLTLYERLMRLDGKSQQQEIEVAVQGQATVGTQEEERAATQGRAEEDMPVKMVKTTLVVHNTEWDILRNLDLLLRTSSIFFGGNSTEAENWLLAINKILEFLDCLNRQKVLFAAFKLEGDAYQWRQMQKKIFESKQNGLDESIRDMVMVEPCETYGKAMDRAMWVEKAVTQFSRIFVKRKGETVEGELQGRYQRVKGLRTKTNKATKRNVVDATSVISDVATSNQGRALNAEKLDIGQMTVLMGSCVTGVVCRDIPLGSVLRRVRQIHSSHKTRIVRQEDLQHDSRMCRT
ncbi:hypothetical protein ACLOJK_038625 [Asimina triloba]